VHSWVDNLEPVLCESILPFAHKLC